MLDRLGEGIASTSSLSTRPLASSLRSRCPLGRRDEGRDFIKQLTAQGSTDINRALLEAVAGADKERPTVVIFMTDGLPTVGEKNPIVSSRT